MEESGYRFGVGVLVLASAMIGVLLVAFFGAVPSLWVDRYRVSFNFPSAPKVTVDTPVRKNGVLIGRVSKIDLLQGNDGVVLTLELERKYELRKGEVPRVASASFITGDAVVEFSMPTPESLLAIFDGSMGTPRDGKLDEQEFAASTEVMPDGYYSRGGQVTKDPQEFLAKLETNFVPVLASLERTMNKFEAVGTSVQEVIGDGSVPFKDFVSSAKTTLDNVNTTVGTINQVAGQIRDADIPRLTANAIAILPDLFKEAQTTLAQTQRTLKGFEEFSASLEGLGKEFEGIGETIRMAVDNANVAIENIAEITEPVSQNSDRLVSGVVNAVDNLDALAIDLKKFTTRLNNSDGTISRLVDNPQMYYKVLDTVTSIQAASRNVQAITQKFQPILGDVRVFTDKVSRDPGGQIGLRSLLSNRPQGVGLK
jgi:phospholipid/cholesterol/gamma-HCH transport system substrate-binding protein